MICADAKPSIQARRRIHPSAPPAPGGGQLVEHEYERLGAVTYFDAWDVRRGRVMGRTERSGGIAAFDRLVWQVMRKEPYRSARRVFWIVDNGSDHRGKASIKRLQKRWRNLILVHTPVHASWLNQAEIYHSIIQRKVLAPNDFHDTAEVARTLNAVRAPLQPDRRTVRLELHPPGPRRATRTARQQQPPRPPAAIAA